MATATQDGELRDVEKRFDEEIRDTAVYGVLPKGTTLATLREKGMARFTGWGSWATTGISSIACSRGSRFRRTGRFGWIWRKPEAYTSQGMSTSSSGACC